VSDDKGRTRPGTVAYLEQCGAAEGRDWRWSDGPWGPLVVVDFGDCIGVKETGPGHAQGRRAILVRSTAVRLCGGKRIAAFMDDGTLPAELPFVAMPGVAAGSN
jgi:hypothetical protein